MENILGVILAGGLARRLGGVDKGLVEVGGAPILARLVARLRPQCRALALNANGDPARFAAFDPPVIADGVGGFAGPLAGVLAGMDHAASLSPAPSAILTVPADTPFVPMDLAERLHEARETAHAEIAVATSAGRVHHAVALWPVALREELRAALARGEGRVSGFIARFESVDVEWPAAPYDPFFNVNRPEDLEVAEAIARKARAGEQGEG